MGGTLDVEVLEVLLLVVELDVLVEVLEVLVVDSSTDEMRSAGRPASSPATCVTASVRPAPAARAAANAAASVLRCTYVEAVIPLIVPHRRRFVTRSPHGGPSGGHHMAEHRIISRREWGAASPTSRYLIDTPTAEAWLHHSAGARDAGGNGVWWDDVRGIQRFHMTPTSEGGRGWSDVAYSFLVGGGQIFEGRGFGVAGGHTRGHNTISHAVCVIGDYEWMQPTDADLEAVAWLLRRGRELGAWGELTGAHRDASGASTACCGRNLIARIPDLRRMAATTDNEQEADDMGDTIKALYALARGDGYDVTVKDPGGFLWWLKVAREAGPTWSVQAAALNTHMLPDLRTEAKKRGRGPLPDIPA